MKNKDQVLLEQAYSKILLEEDDKFQPNDPEMQELSKIGLGEEYPEDEDPRNLETDSSPEEKRADYDNILNAVNSIINSEEKYKNIGKTIEDFIQKNISEMAYKFKENYPSLVEGDEIEDIKSYFDKQLVGYLKNQSKFLANL